MILNLFWWNLLTGLRLPAVGAGRGPAGGGQRAGRHDLRARRHPHGLFTNSFGRARARQVDECHEHMFKMSFLDIPYWYPLFHYLTHALPYPIPPLTRHTPYPSTWRIAPCEAGPSYQDTTLPHPN